MCSGSSGPFYTVLPCVFVCSGSSGPFYTRLPCVFVFMTMYTVLPCVFVCSGPCTLDYPLCFCVQNPVLPITIVFVCSGPSTLIEVNMQVRSMGPISEMDMVGEPYTFPDILLQQVKQSRHFSHQTLEIRNTDLKINKSKLIF